MIRLYNTAARARQELVPINPDRVTMYVCGPTVYGRAHIGNFRPAVVFDVLQRLLRHTYGPDKVIYARNITDIDDKIMDKARAEGVSIDVITERYESSIWKTRPPLAWNVLICTRTLPPASRPWWR